MVEVSGHSKDQHETYVTPPSSSAQSDLNNKNLYFKSCRVPSVYIGKVRPRPAAGFYPATIFVVSSYLRFAQLVLVRPGKH